MFSLGLPDTRFECLLDLAEKQFLAGNGQLAVAVYVLAVMIAVGGLGRDVAFADVVNRHCGGKLR